MPIAFNLEISDPASPSRLRTNASALPASSFEIRPISPYLPGLAYLETGRGGGHLSRVTTSADWARELLLGPACRQRYCCETYPRSERWASGLPAQCSARLELRLSNRREQSKSPPTAPRLIHTHQGRGLAPARRYLPLSMRLPMQMLSTSSSLSPFSPT